jgi:hypothetical protein
MKRQLITLLCILSIFLFSCQKDVDSPAGDLPTIASVHVIVDTVLLPTIMNADRTLYPDTLYEINGNTFVTAGATLTILPGTRLEGIYKVGAGFSNLIITKTGKIHAKGNYNNPIVFTSSLKDLPEGRTVRRPGDWGGITVLGDAAPCVDEYLTCGGVNSLGVDVSIGGLNKTHNAGTIQYCRIEYAGAGVQPYENDEAAALVFRRVGSGTTVSNIICSYSGANGFTFSKGTVNARYLIDNSSYHVGIYVLAPYDGNIQFGVSVQNPAYASQRDRGIMTYTDDIDCVCYPGYGFGLGRISNFTLIGRGQNPGQILRSCGIFMNSKNVFVENNIVMGYHTGIFASTFEYGDKNKLNYNISHGLQYATLPDNTYGGLTWGTGNDGFTGALPLTIINSPYVTSMARYRGSALEAIAGSIAFSGYNYTNQGPGITPVNYRGAGVPGVPVLDGQGNIITPNNWLRGQFADWINFDPQ